MTKASITGVWVVFSQAFMPNHSKSISFTGILIHELLMGKPPFRGKDQMQTYNLILRGIDCIQLSQKLPKKAQLIIKRVCREA